MFFRDVKFGIFKQIQIQKKSLKIIIIGGLKSDAK